jgi:hypothetical protein
MEDVIIPAVAAAMSLTLAWILSNWKDIFGWRRRVQKEEMEMGQSLMKAINDGRREIMDAYAIIDTMVIENKHLKRQNMELTIERDRFKELAEQLKDKLEKVNKDLDECAKQAKKYIAKNEENQNKRDPRRNV